MSIPYYINVASSPALGYLVDRYGQCAWVVNPNPNSTATRTVTPTPTRQVCFLAPAVFTAVHVLLGAHMTRIYTLMTRIYTLMTRIYTLMTRIYRPGSC